MWSRMVVVWMSGGEVCMGCERGEKMFESELSAKVGCA